MKIKNENTMNDKLRDERLAMLQRKFEQALSTRAPSAESTFSEAYELIERVIKQGLPQKEVIALVNQTYDLKLHPASFRELLKNEREARDSGGHPALCPTCGHVLAPTLTDEPAKAAGNVSAHTGGAQ
ncbi:hypothetical protein [Stenotrophomonas sp. Sm0581]|uniref:hypothetical protein n=1 Tax=Stenotrophomonas sp. Sm0581 TaxID=3002749 RepID=UPI0027E52375|nr:hypothetical protein [Stenotrophomonas sp. Sm0581]MDQ7301000.1 hypothetical protein [Stenotrophomonas sp. Sm0581]